MVIKIQLYLYILATKSTKTMEQLDEHLSGMPQHSPPSFIQIGLSFFIYFIILIISFIVYYGVLESSNLITFLDQYQKASGIPLKHISMFLALELIFIGSNYYLQKQLYNLFGESVLKTILIPVLFWGIIIGIAFTNDYYQGVSFSNFFMIFVRIGTMLLYYSTLCSIIGFYFKHQNKVQYYSALLRHWILATTFFYFL